MQAEVTYLMTLKLCAIWLIVDVDYYGIHDKRFEKSEIRGMPAAS